MKYFDNSIQATFQEDEQGDRVHYPYGPFGRGRIMPDVQTEKRIVRAHKMGLIVFYAGLFFLTFLIIYFEASISLIFIGIILYGVVSWLWQMFLLRGCQYTKDRRKLTDFYQRLGRLQSYAGLWFVMIGSGLFVIVGILLFVLPIGIRVMSVLGPWRIARFLTTLMPATYAYSPLLIFFGIFFFSFTFWVGFRARLAKLDLEREASCVDGSVLDVAN